MIKINIGDKADVNAQTIITGRGCVIGQSGSGKSYLVGVITEELCLNNLPFMIIDTEGEYHNLKLKFDAIWVGNDEKADLGFGIDYSDLIHRSIDDLVPIILDVSDSSDSSAIVSEVLSKLYEIETIEHKPYLVIVEEADKFVPQVVRSKNINVIEELSVRGRKRGIGLLIATQRPANVSKNVLSQCSYGFIGKMTIQNDINAIDILLESEEDKRILTRLTVGEFVSFGLGFNQIIKVKERVIKHLGETPILAVQKKIDSFDDILNEIKHSEDKVYKEVEDIKENPKPIKKLTKERKKEGINSDILEANILQGNYTMEDAQNYANSKVSGLINSKFLKYQIEMVDKVYIPALYSKLYIQTKNLSVVKENYAVIGFNGEIFKINQKDFQIIRKPDINLKGEELSDVEKAILYLIRGYNKISLEKIIKITKYDKKLIQKILNNLIDKGVILFNGKYYLLKDFGNNSFNNKLELSEAYIKTTDIIGKIKYSDILKEEEIVFAGCKIEDTLPIYIPLYKIIFRKDNKLKTMLLDSISFKDQFNEFKTYIDISSDNQ